MRPPESFDSNEWFIIAVCILLITLSLFLRRRFLFTQMLIIFTVNFFLASSLDHILAGQPYDLYDIMDVPEFEIFDFIIYVIIYPLSGYLVLYFFSIWRDKGLADVLFLLIASLATVGLEWIANQFHVYEHINWSYYHSGISYLGVFCINMAVYFWITDDKFFQKN
jgi:hypothetical protein